MSNDKQSFTFISSHPDSFSDYFVKIWKFRSLIWVFAKRDLKVKYAQTWLGVSWSLIQPLTSLFIFTFFFGYLLKIKSEGMPFPIYVLSGLLGWNFFSYVVSSGSLSMQESATIMKKIYFPKSILPFSKAVLGLIDLILSIMILIPLMLYFEIAMSWHIIFLPIVLLFNLICSLSLVFLVASLAYKNRDLMHLLPYILYFGIWFTPVFFTETMLPDEISFILQINPMSSVVQMWRWVLFGFGDFNFMWVINFLAVIVICSFGMYLYNKKESEFADFI